MPQPVERPLWPDLGRRVLAHYRDCARDGCDPELLQFYRALRAFVRAKVAAWHLEDEASAEAQTRWRGPVYWYLDAAATSLRIDRHRSAIAGSR